MGVYQTPTAVIEDIDDFADIICESNWSNWHDPVIPDEGPSPL